MALDVTSTAKVLTLAELFDLFGPMPASRIRSSPAPGTATEQDWLDLESKSRSDANSRMAFS